MEVAESLVGIVESGVHPQPCAFSLCIAPRSFYMPPLVFVSCEFYILGRRRVEGVKKKQWHHILVGGQRLVDGQ